MPYQPMSPTPYLVTIDSTVDNVFTCVINPRDTIYKYVLKVININSTTGDPVLTVTEDEIGRTYSGASSQISSAQTSDNIQLPISGTYKNDTMLRIPIPAHYILDKSSETNSTQDKNRQYGDYVWNITLYDVNDNSTTSCDYYFKVRDKAKISLSNNGTALSTSSVNNITSGNICVQATYSQAQNILPDYYCFNLYLDNDLIHTTGNVISSNILFEYDSLVSDNNYKLELLIFYDDKTQNRYVYDLNVSYNYFSTPINPVIDINYDKEYVSLDYSYNISIVGNCDEDEENPTFEKYTETSTNNPPSGEATNGVCIPKNQYIYWNERTAVVPLDLDNTNQLINWHGHEGYNGVIVEKIDDKLSANTIIVGHEILNNISHSTVSSAIYTDAGDEAMPIGITNNNIQGGFYYKFGTSPKVYISEFSKITSAIYKTNTANMENTAMSKINDDTLYILNDTDEIADNNVILTNDAANKYWWLIGILDSSAVVSRGKKFSETVVSE